MASLSAAEVPSICIRQSFMFLVLFCFFFLDCQVTTLQPKMMKSYQMVTAEVPTGTRPTEMGGISDLCMPLRNVPGLVILSSFSLINQTVKIWGNHPSGLLPQARHYSQVLHPLCRSPCLCCHPIVAYFHMLSSG